MGYQIVWTESGNNDLKQIVSFIAIDDSDAAERFGLSIIDQIEALSAHPRMERIVPEEQIEEIRELIVPPYRIVYEIYETERVIYVVRVWHSARGKPQIH